MLFFFFSSKFKPYSFLSRLYFAHGLKAINTSFPHRVGKYSIQTFNEIHRTQSTAVKYEKAKTKLLNIPFSYYFRFTHDKSEEITSIKRFCSTKNIPPTRSLNAPVIALFAALINAAVRRSISK